MTLFENVFMIQQFRRSTNCFKKAQKLLILLIDIEESDGLIFFILVHEEFPVHNYSFCVYFTQSVGGSRPAQEEQKLLGPL